MCHGHPRLPVPVSPRAPMLGPRQAPMLGHSPILNEPAPADDAAVIMSELVTNALMHRRSAVNGAAHEDVELILWRHSGQVVCAVTDPGTGAPVLVQPDPFGEAGRGLHMIQALSATWGWTRLGDSRKAVWAAMGVPGTDVGGRSG
jgi:two-component sensor histidine kinase